MSATATLAVADENLSDGRPELTPPRRSRWAISVGIAGYLAVLLSGVVIHTFDTPAKQTLPSYLVVWDMFCGWAGYERRLHFVAEGESGTLYDASEVPGAVITPHGPVGRRHFDFRNSFSSGMIMNVLNRTEHEPIRRVYVVEESWSKRFNLPPSLQTMGPSEKQRFFYTQATYDGDGEPLDTQLLWHVVQNQRAIYANPRLRAAADSRRQLFAASE